MNIYITLASLIVVVNSAPQGVGIDFAGFKVGAGLDGGPHAFAQTPFGPKAAAGVGGQTGAFAGAEVNEGLGAAAGVGANGAGSVAQAPGVVKYKYKGVSPSVGVRSSVNVESAPVPASTVGGGATYQVTKTASPNFFNDIFNIPISTLRAVNQLVNGVQTTKQVSASSYPTNTYKEISVGSQPSGVSVSKSVAPVTVSKPDLAVRTTVTKTASPDLYNNIFNLAEAPVSTAVPTAGFGFQWSKTYGPGFVPPVVNVEAVSPVTTEKIETVQTTGKQDGSVENVPAGFGFQWSKTYGIAPPVFNVESSVSTVAPPSTEKPKVEESSTTQSTNNVQNFPVGGFGFHYAKAFGPGYYRPPVYRYRYKTYTAPRPSVGLNYSVSKTASPQFFNSIFNIPIAALSAVNQLVNGIGVSGSVAKQVSVN